MFQRMNICSDCCEIVALCIKYFQDIFWEKWSIYPFSGLFFFFFCTLKSQTMFEHDYLKSD